MLKEAVNICQKLVFGHCHLIVTRLFVIDTGVAVLHNLEVGGT
jgi:hypothetical protein